MTFYAEIAVSVCLIISGLFGLVGSFGLVRLRDTMQRLHAPTKATTLGVGGALIASTLYFSLTDGTLSFHEVLIMLFLFLSAPITANFIAKAFMLNNVQEAELPAVTGDSGWAGYQDPPAQATDEK